jgi:phosphoglycolate phosphatase-like HAD superfamily hydrolase
VKLVLFDIDGTLLLSDGAGRRAIMRALLEVYGATGPTDYRFDGKTDPQIVRDLMRMAGLDDERIDGGMTDVFERYVECLHEELRAPEHRPSALPGVTELLDALGQETRVTLGLLTGNLHRGAQAKLDAVGIGTGRFRVGAYGSDHEQRPELPAVALARARAELGIAFEGTQVVVIGDTPADLTCGRGVGAGAIGVATGRFTVEELSLHDPIAVFEDFRDTALVVQAIVGR